MNSFTKMDIISHRGVPSRSSVTLTKKDFADAWEQIIQEEKPKVEEVKEVLEVKTSESTEATESTPRTRSGRVTYGLRSTGANMKQIVFNENRYCDSGSAFCKCI